MKLFTRLVRLALLAMLLSSQAQAHRHDSRFDEARQATRCGALVTTPLVKAANTDPARKVMIEMLPAMLFARAKTLGAPRPMQEAWIAEVGRELTALRATPDQRRARWNAEMSRCDPLIRDEFEQFRKKHNSPQQLRQQSHLHW